MLKYLDEIFDAHQDIHELQFDLLNNQLDMIEAMQKYKNETKETVKNELAKLFGLDMAALMVLCHYMDSLNQKLFLR